MLIDNKIDGAIADLHSRNNIDVQCSPLVVCWKVGSEAGMNDGQTVSVC